MPQPTLQEILSKAIEHLHSKGIGEPKRSAELLLCHALSCRRIDLYLQFDKPVAEKELELFRALIRRRLRHEPVQYILCETEFYSLPMRISPAVLVPRPETEILVREAISRLEQIGRPATALDIGTGSGCVAIALAKHVPGAHIEAIDISREALEVAGENAERNGVSDRVRFARRNLLDDDDVGRLASYDLVVSNPPYVSAEEFQDLQPEIRDYEPRNATTDEADGYRFFRRIAAIHDRIMSESGSVLVEAGAGQAERIVDMFRSAGLTALRSIRDYAGIERVVIATRESRTAGE